MHSPFDPSSIAIVGASDDFKSISGRPILFLQKHGYSGDIYPVNPNHDEIGGLPCYPDVPSLPEVPDLVLVIVPANIVPDIVEDCTEVGIESVLIVSSGFSETGNDEDVEAERRLVELAETHDITLIGPNSQGLINFPERAIASFTAALRREELITGNVSFVTQSGAFGGALTTMLQDRGVGLDKWVSSGNEASTESLDFVRMMLEDGSTEIAAGYVEGFEDGRKLVEIKRTDAGIELPFVVLKTGKSNRGKAAAQSHTGTVAGRQEVYEAIFKETGVIPVDDTDHFIDVVESLTRIDAYPGEKVGVITTSGGAGIHIADVVEEEVGVTLPDLSEQIVDWLQEHLPAYGSAVNPVDITAQVASSPDTFGACIERLLEADELDTVVLQITNVSGERALRYAETITAAAEGSATQIFLVWTGGIEKERALDRYAEAGIPVFENPARCIRAIAALARFAASRERLYEAQDLPARPPTYESDGESRTVTEVEAKVLLANYGISAPGESLVNSAEEAAEAADDLGYPVVAKLVSPELIHRNEVGAIKLDLASSSDVEAAFAELQSIAAKHDADPRGVSIQEQIDDGLELAMGIATGTDFGPLVMLGSGGVDIESIGDVTFRTIPLERAQAASMINDLDAVSESDLRPPQQAAIVDALCGLSDLYCDNPWITEADVNPAILSDDRLLAVDALILGVD